MTSVLFDFSNLRAGGGLQVASATLQDLAEPGLAQHYPWMREQLCIWISPPVASFLTVDPALLPGRVSFRETEPSLLAPLRRPAREFDIRFTLFGPTYSGRRARCEIAGFAEVTMVYAPEEYGQTRSAQFLRTRVGNAVKRIMAKRSDIFVTETKAMADRVVERIRVNPEQIRIVPNRPHPIFCGHPTLEGPPPRADPGELHLAYATRAYPHKNLPLIGPAGDLLAERTGTRLRVHTTLRDDELAGLPEASRRWIVNHGPSSLPEVLEIYRAVDGIFFPSLLEASSGTPLEANVLGLPLIASDRDFVRSSAQAFALFEPTDPASAAAAMARLAESKQEAWRSVAVIAADYRRRLANSSRTLEYLEIISKEVERAGPRDGRSIRTLGDGSPQEAPR